MIKFIIYIVFFLHLFNTVANSDESLAFIPPGEFIMGSDERFGREGIDYGVDESPVHIIYVDSYYIDKYETTNSEYLSFIKATGHKLPDNKTHTYDPYIWKDGVYPPGSKDRPISLVDFSDADSYCRWRGKRLPTEEEWEKAARGTDGRIYPWGDRFDKFKTNTWDMGLKMTVSVYRFKNGVSPYGLYNMAGNVFEWTSSWYNSYPGSALEREEMGNNTYKITRGGGFMQEGEIYARAADRQPEMPDSTHRTLGFRCAKD